MFAEVIIDVANSEVDKIFDYIVSKKDINIVKPGSLVSVPFGPKAVSGFIISLKEKSDYEQSKLKEITKVYDFAISAERLKLIDFMREKFFLRRIDILRLFLPPLIRKGVKERKNVLAQNLMLNEKPKHIKLNEQQSAAIDKIVASAAVGGGKPILVHGVTGSGKTEIYLAAIEKVLARGKGAIMLVPEISLTPQIFARFKNRFGDAVAVIHSGLSATERRSEFKKIESRQASVVVGARSAIFSPVKNLGIVVIDEEHDSSYFSETNPRYSTHEVAEQLCKNYGATLVLGSATPSIETYYKAKCGAIDLITITKRVGNATLPTFEVVDMCGEIRRGNDGIFSSRALEELTKAVNEKKQALVFINRRGFSSFVRCFDCGHIPKCVSCDVSLVWHKEDKQLKCHFCGKRFKQVQVCEKCGGTMRLGAVGSERVCSELKKIFTDTAILRLDNDTVAGDKSNYVEILEKFRQTRPAILVGTQMVAKGHDFEDINVSVIVDADLSLHFSDFRAAARSYELITQVAGRSGRKEAGGTCITQTYTPRHYVYHFAKEGSYSGFYEKEINVREVTKFPPFADICRVLITSENDNTAKNKTIKIFDEIKKLKTANPDIFIYFDAMKSPIKRIKNKFRYQILMRLANKDTKICGKIMQQVSRIVCDERGRNVTIFLEDNPQNLS